MLCMSASIFSLSYPRTSFRSTRSSGDKYLPIIRSPPWCIAGSPPPTMTTTNYIAQTLLPPSTGFPAQLQVRRVALRHAGDAVWHLTHPHAEVSTLGAACAVGVAYHISPSGALAFVALAGTHSIFLVDLPKDEKAPHVDSALAQLLGNEGPSAAGNDNARPRLVGFTLARTAVRLQQVLQKPIRGVDVGKLDTSAEKDLTPAEVAQQWLSRNVNQWEVTRLWVGDERTAERNVCLQAWLAAWSVIRSCWRMFY